MSGHSKWSTIKHKKAATDAKKGKAFTQAANMIALAARQGGGDPKMNPTLALAISKAKAVNMPVTNIERAIKRGTGEGGAARIDEVLYEGYGPAGTAILVEAATDNKNRTVAEVRSAFTKSGGSIGTAGSVAYLFDRKGRIEVKVVGNLDELELVVIESGADDFEEEDGAIIVLTPPNELMAVKEKIEGAGFTVDVAELAYLPKSYIAVSDVDKAKSVLKLVDTLEDLDDVVAVHSNFDIPEEILRELA